MDAVETFDCEQYAQSSGQRPLFTLMRKLSLTRLPKYRNRTRATSETSQSVSESGSWRTVSASSRVGASRRIARRTAREIASLASLATSRSPSGPLGVIVDASYYHAVGAGPP